MVHGSRFPQSLRAIILLVCATAGAGAQDGVRGTRADPVQAAALTGHHYVVTIGIDDYARWPHLQTAVSDATGFAKLLEDHFGYEAGAPPLLDAAASRQAIVALVDDDLRQKLKPEDDLILFFAGHGTTRQDTVADSRTETGFLVPYEARARGTVEHFSDYINVDELLRTISSLPARHVLVILDSCHSGLALGSSFSSARGTERFSRDMERKVSRKVIASAQGDQNAADNGPVAGHSLFTGLMMRALETGKADSFAQGFVTASQLGAYVQHEVGVFENARQTPLFGAFYRDEAGELILRNMTMRADGRPAPSSLLADKLAQGDAAMMSGDPYTLERVLSEMESMKPDALAAQWMKTGRAFAARDSGTYGKEAVTLDRMLAAERVPVYVDSGEIPRLLQRRRLMRLTTVAGAESGLSIRIWGNSQNNATADGTVGFQGKIGDVFTLDNYSLVNIKLKNMTSAPMFLLEAIRTGTMGRLEVDPLGKMLAPGEEAELNFAHDSLPEEMKIHVLAAKRAEDEEVMLLDRDARRSTFTIDFKQ